MKKRLYYIVPIVLLLLGLLGPVLYSNNKGKTSAPAASQGETVNSPSSGPSTGVTGGTGNGANLAANTPAEESLSGQNTVGPANINQAKAEGESTKGTTATPPATDKNSPSPSDQNEGGYVTVQIAVVGKNNELYFGPSAVKVAKKNIYGTTALGALAATGLPFEASARFPDLIETIAGTKNKGESGWVYNVNGVFAMVAAVNKPVANGDRIIWWYSKTIDSPAPDWDQLKRG